MTEMRFPDVPVGAEASEPARGKGAARLAVLGDPIEHSRSPQLHLAAYRVLGLDWEYWRWQLTKGGLAPALESRGPSWRGFSVTAPLKAEALAFAAATDPTAKLTGAANTLVFDALDAGSGATAYNTDVAGIVAALDKYQPAARSADVLGAGDTAASAAVAAAELGAKQVRVWARRPEAAAQLASGLAERGMQTPVISGNLADWRPDAETALVIDTVPGGCPPTACLKPVKVPLLSAAYDPWPTELAKLWQDGGGAVIAGTEMLLQQAVVQVRLFSGRNPDAQLPNEQLIVEKMRAALETA